MNRLKVYGIAGLLLTLAVPYIIGLQNPGTTIETRQSLCPMKLLTGFPCPGCGITKSLMFFYQGNIGKSLYYHALGPLAALFCVLAILLLITELITGQEYFRQLLYSKKLAYILAAGLMIYHTGRITYFVSANSWSDILAQSIWR